MKKYPASANTAITCAKLFKTADVIALFCVNA